MVEQRIGSVFIRSGQKLRANNCRKIQLNTPLETEMRLYPSAVITGKNCQHRSLAKFFARNYNLLFYVHLLFSRRSDILRFLSQTAFQRQIALVLCVSYSLELITFGWQGSSCFPVLCCTESEPPMSTAPMEIPLQSQAVADLEQEVVPTLYGTFHPARQLSVLSGE